MGKPRKGTARLRRINDSAKECAEVIVQNSAGRPPKYHPHFVHMINTLAAGLVSSTNVQLGAMFGVDEDTVNLWMDKHPPFSRAIKNARAKVDMEIEGALAARAKGFQHPAVKIFLPEGSRQPVYAPYTEQYPPDPVSAIFWLKNRHPDKWRDRKNEEPIIPPADAAAELRAALAEMDQVTDKGESK